MSDGDSVEVVQYTDDADAAIEDVSVTDTEVLDEAEASELAEVEDGSEMLMQIEEETATAPSATAPTTETATEATPPQGGRGGATNEDGAGGPPQGGGGGQGGGMMPEDALTACEDLSEGDSCTVTTPEGEEADGTCTTMETDLACMPDNMPVRQ